MSPLIQKIAAVLAKLGIGLVVIVGVGIGAIIYADKKSAGQSEALRSQVKTGMTWAEVADQLETERNWHMIIFRGEDPNCGFVSGGGGPNRNLRGHYALVAAGKQTSIKNLRDPEVMTQTKLCPNAVVCFHPSFSFSKMDFSVVFDASGKVVSTTPTRTWD